MIKFRMKVLKSASGFVFKIEKIFDVGEHSTEDKKTVVVDNIEYNIGQEMREENLYRLKMPGIMLVYV